MFEKIKRKPKGATKLDSKSCRKMASRCRKQHFKAISLGREDEAKRHQQNYERWITLSEQRGKQ